MLQLYFYLFSYYVYVYIFHYYGFDAVLKNICNIFAKQFRLNSHEQKRLLGSSVLV